VIRGDFNADSAKTVEDAIDPQNSGYFARIKRIYDDNPKHWVMLDVDNFDTGDLVPIEEPEKAVQLYIEKVLPECFHSASYHWQLSASAGQPKNKHILKAHIWFWLKTPYDSVQLTAWAKATSPLIDVAPLRTVQVHYTANPIYKDGMVDPVTRRSGLVRGWLDDQVDLVIDDVILLRAYEQYGGESSDYEFLNPAEKPGVVGAFHRAYEVEDVISELLQDEFEMEPGSERRVTWLNGGGTPGGCFITDDRQHFGSTHNTDPFDNRVVNLFDLVRHYRFGHLDEGLDAFEMLDMRDRPSYQAMVDWCYKDQRVMEQLESDKVDQSAAARSLRDSLKDQIEEADTESILREKVCAAIRSSHTLLHKLDIDVLAKAIQTKLNGLTSVKPSLASVRELITPVRREIDRPQGLPGWAHGYFYVTSQGKLFRYDSNEWLTREAFDFKHNPNAGTDADGNQLSAYSLLRDNPLTPRVEKAFYMPHLGPTFELDGEMCVNAYRPSSTPAAKPVSEWTEKDHKAVAMVQRHFEILCSDRPEVTNALLDWLAYCVQFPGIKMRYSWLIWGGEGAGKTWIGNLMAEVMGGPNVRLVAVRDVLNETFNAWADGAVLSVIEEIRITGHRKDAWDNLKEPLTNDKLTITKKGLDPYQAPNVTNYIMFSNHFDAVPLSLGSRRVAVIEVPFNGDETLQQLNAMAIKEGYESQTEYFDALFDCVHMHGPALRAWFLNRVFSEGFNPQGWAPATEERKAMALASISDDEDVARAVIERGSYWVSSKVVSPGSLKTAMAYWDGEETIVTPERASFLLAKMGFKKYGPRLKVDGKAIRVWIRGVELSGDVDKDNESIRHLLAETGTQAEEDDFLK
jgi:hypothetical protein